MDLEQQIKEVTEGLAPHIVRQTIVTGKERVFVVVLIDRRHPFMVAGIPEEVFSNQRGQREDFEFTLFPSDSDGLKKGRHLQKRRFETKEEALKAFDALVASIVSGDIR